MDKVDANQENKTLSTPPGAARERPDLRGNCRCYIGDVPEKRQGLRPWTSDSLEADAEDALPHSVEQGVLSCHRLH